MKLVEVYLAMVPISTSKLRLISNHIARMANFQRGEGGSEGKEEVYDVFPRTYHSIELCFFQGVNKHVSLFHDLLHLLGSAYDPSLPQI